MNSSITPSTSTDNCRPTISNNGLLPTVKTQAIDEQGQTREVLIAEERPLTIVVDQEEIVTLMTLGTHPELLTLGYLHNQGLVENLEAIFSVNVDWNLEQANVKTISGKGITDIDSAETTFTNLASISNPTIKIQQAELYLLLKNISSENEIYRVAGGVHGCAICDGADVLYFVEDIGRHNAADTIAGHMLFSDISGDNKYLYSTGRLTSEVVMKTARMNIPVLISRSGITHLGLAIAKHLGITLIGRAKGSHFLVYHGDKTIVYDRSVGRTD